MERLREFSVPADRPSSMRNVVSSARTLVTGDAHFFDENVSLEHLKQLLASDNVSEKRTAMKHVLAYIFQGQNMSSLFTDVVKNIHVSAMDIRKLAYSYVVHYSSVLPNEALLSVSAFQKDLTDASMYVRSLALRNLSALSIPVIHPVVMVAVKKCSTDVSTVVRKTAAISIAQAHRFVETADVSVARPLIDHLLGDSSLDVMGAAALSLQELCSNEFSLLHRHFRRICRSLWECDECCQTVLLQALLRYGRSQFKDPNCPSSRSGERIKQQRHKANHEKGAEGDVFPPSQRDADSASEVQSEPSDTDSTTSSDDECGMLGTLKSTRGRTLDPDHRLLLQCTKMLLTSLDHAVVVAAASLYFHLAPREELSCCIVPLLRLLSSSPMLLGSEIKGSQVTLSILLGFADLCRASMIPFLNEFFVHADDTSDVMELKISIITRLTTKENLDDVLREFKSYVRSFSTKKTVVAIRGLGDVCVAVPGQAGKVIPLLHPLFLQHQRPQLITEGVMVLRQLVAQGESGRELCRVTHRLMLQLLSGSVVPAEARAAILWLVGENVLEYDSVASAAPDCFRLFARRFTEEAPCVKRQILTLGLKLWVLLVGEGSMAERFKTIFIFVLDLVQYDSDYELRDRGRLVRATLDRKSTAFQSLKAALQAPRSLPLPPEQRIRSAGHLESSISPLRGADRGRLQLGTLSQFVGVPVAGYQPLPAWGCAEVEPHERDPVISLSNKAHPSLRRFDYGAQLSDLSSDLSEMEQKTESSTGSSTASSATEEGDDTSSVSATPSLNDEEGDNDGSGDALGELEGSAASGSLETEETEESQDS